MAEWRTDKENAPRDGTTILVCYRTLLDAPGGPHYDCALIEWDEMEDEGWLEAKTLEPFSEHFHAWLPIPEPPVDTEEEQE